MTKPLAYEEGFKARKDGVTVKAIERGVCPYALHTEEWHDWQWGYTEAYRDEPYWRYVEGQVISRETHNRTLYIEYHAWGRMRIKPPASESMWHLEDSAYFRGYFQFHYDVVVAVKDITPYTPMTEAEFDAAWVKLFHAPVVELADTHDRGS